MNMANALNPHQGKAIAGYKAELAVYEEDLSLNTQDSLTLESFLKKNAKGNRVLITVKVAPTKHNPVAAYRKAYNLASHLLQTHKIKPAHILIEVRENGNNTDNQLIVEVLEECSAPLFQPET